MQSKHEQNMSIFTENIIFNSTKNTSSAERLIIEDISINETDDEDNVSVKEDDDKRKDDENPCDIISPTFIKFRRAYRKDAHKPVRRKIR